MKYWSLQLSHRHLQSCNAKARRIGCNSGSSTAAASSAQPARNTYLSASLTAGILMSASDVIAQFLENKAANKGRKHQAGFQWTPARTLRMASFGALVIGPYQRWWYSLLAWRLPGANLRNFIAKIAANQLLGGPIIMSTVFVWNATLTGHLTQLPGKLKQDFVPTLVHGWQFWVPASSANFYLIPLDLQVLFMSTCSFVWNTYLSYAANKD